MTSEKKGVFSGSKTINSGSKGNGYALIPGEDVLLLECGVPRTETRCIQQM